MKSSLTCWLGMWLWVVAAAARAALETTDKMAPEPTVGVGWVVLFLVIFVGVCVGIAIAIFRAARKDNSGKDS